MASGHPPGRRAGGGAVPLLQTLGQPDLVVRGTTRFLRSRRSLQRVQSGLRRQRGPVHLPESCRVDPGAPSSGPAHRAALPRLADGADSDPGPACPLAGGLDPAAADGVHHPQSGIPGIVPGVHLGAHRLAQRLAPPRERPAFRTGQLPEGGPHPGPGHHHGESHVCAGDPDPRIRLRPRGFAAQALQRPERHPQRGGL